MNTRTTWYGLFIDDDDVDLDTWSLFDWSSLDEPEPDGEDASQLERLLDRFGDHQTEGDGSATRPSVTVTETLEGSRRRQGLCPQCGTAGPFVNMTMTCPTHGPY